MSVDNDTREFLASAPSLTAALITMRGSMVMWVAMVASAVVLFVGHARPWSLAVASAVFFGAPLAWFGYAWSRSRRQIVIGVSHGAVTVNLMPDSVFSIAEAPLGIWVTQGVALHLRSGSTRFVVGGRGCRVTPSTRLDAPPVRDVDALLNHADFEQLLTLGRHGKASGHGPAQREPARCLLFPNPLLAEEFGPLGFRRHLQHQRSSSHPTLALDLDRHTLRLTDPDSNTVTASALCTQVTAAPVIFQPDSVTSGDGSTYDYPRVTGLILQIPGQPPMGIGCLEMGEKFSFSDKGFRYSWSDASRVAERSDFVVSAADWLTLTEKFGLNPYLLDRDQPPAGERRSALPSGGSTPESERTSAFSLPPGAEHVDANSDMRANRSTSSRRVAIGTWVWLLVLAVVAIGWRPGVHYLHDVMPGMNRPAPGWVGLLLIIGILLFMIGGIAARAIKAHRRADRRYWTNRPRRRQP